MRRVLWAVPIVLSVVVITFGLMHLAPGNPWDAGDQSARGTVVLDDATLRALKAKYGLDRPLAEQLAVYVANAAQLDLGNSYRYQTPVRDLILRAWPKTLVLGLVAFLVIVVVGLGLGVVAGLRQSSLVDHAVVGLATLAASIPTFVIGIVLIVVFSVRLRRATGGSVFLPSGGFGLDEHLVLPVATLSILPIAFLARLCRSSILEVVRLDHVRMARAKGLTERRLIARHVLKNAFVPVATTLGPLFAFLVTGSVVTETVFHIPGIGGLFIEAVGARDYPVILGATIVFTIVVTAANLVVDLVYGFIDPRMRTE